MSVKSKKELEDENDQLRDLVHQLKNDNKQWQPTVDSTLSSVAVGLAIKGDKYHIVRIAYDMETGASKLLSSDPVDRGFHIAVAKVKEVQYNEIIKDLKVI